MASPTDESTPVKPQAPGEVTVAVVVAFVVLSALVLSAVVVLEALGRPVGNVILIVTALVVPSVGTLLQSRKSDRNQAVLHQVVKNTNGRLSGLLDDRAVLEDQVRRLGGIPLTLPTPRLTTETDELAAQQPARTAGQHADRSTP